MSTNTMIIRGAGETIRTWVEVAGQLIDLEPGCSSQAERAVREAGL